MDSEAASEIMFDYLQDCKKGMFFSHLYKQLNKGILGLIRYNLFMTDPFLFLKNIQIDN